MTDKDSINKLINTLFNERERRLLDNCNEYEMGDPAGLPGHSLIIMVARLHTALLFFCEAKDNTPFGEVLDDVTEDLRLHRKGMGRDRTACVRIEEQTK